MKNTKIAVLFLALVLSGCSAIGPTSSPDFPRLVAMAVPDADGEARLFGPGNWFPNVRGFTDVRSAYLVVALSPVPGVVVLTDRSILLQQWDSTSERFDTVKRIPFSDIKEVSLDSYGVAHRFVVRKQDLSYDSFDFSKGQGMVIDGAKAEEAHKLLTRLK